MKTLLQKTNFTANSAKSIKAFVTTVGLMITLLVSTASFGQVNVTYTAMTAVTCPATPTATISTPPTGLTFSQMSRGAGVTCGVAAGSITGSGFNGTLAANLTASKWYTFSITSDASTAFTLNSLSIVSRVSNATGANFSVQYSIGAGAKTAIGSFTPTTAAVAYTITPGSAISVGASQVLNIFVIPNNLTAVGTTARVENNTSANVTASAAVSTDWCNVQFPTTTQSIVEGSTLNVYAQAYKSGLTEAAGAGAGLSAWIGYSPTNNAPSNASWTWVPATFNSQVGNNDEFVGTLGSGILPGTYYYASRFQISGGPFTYGGSAGIWSSDSVTLNINADLVDYCNVQYPLSGTITQGDAYSVYAQVYEPGITNGAGQGAGITAWIGYSSADTNPNTGGWTWVAATYNTDSGNNDEYNANIATGLAPGVYFYASRFQKSGSLAYQYGGTAGVWSANNGVLTINTLAAPVATAATGVLQTEFNANWNAVTGATGGYLLDVATTATFGSTSPSSVAEGFAAGTTAPSGWVFTGSLGTYTSAGNFGASSPSIQMNASTQRIQTTTVPFSATSLSFWIKGNSTDAISALLVEGFNGSTWVTVQNLNPIPIAGTTITYNSGSSPALAANLTQFRFTYTKSSGNIGFDDVTIGYDVVTPSFVSGYNAKPIAGQATITSLVNTLAAETTYYYRLRAVNGAVVSGNSNVISVMTKPVSVTWNGTAWSNVSGPDSDIEAVIAGVYVSGTDGEFTAKKVTLSGSGALTVSAGTNITVEEDVINNTSLTIENNANLIQNTTVTNTGSGTTTVSRNSASLMRQDYTLWSSPVAGQQLQAFSPMTLSSRFYTYDSGSNNYVATSATGSFVTGTGYLIRMPNNHPVTPTTWSGTFTGTLNNGPVSLSVSSGTYNAIGNPYPSTIDADLFISANSLTEALYFWRKTNNAATNSYATYTLAGGAGTGSNSGDPLGLTPNGTIQVGQGFIAKATSSTLDFTNTMRVANASTQFLRTNENRSRIWLDLSNADGALNQMMVAYMPTATAAVDAAIDGRFYGDALSALTSTINNDAYTIQGRAPFDANDVVALGFKAETAGNYTITLSQFDGLFEATTQAIYLKDTFTNTTHNLRAGSYTFASEAGAFANRFEIVYAAPLAVNQNTFDANGVVVYHQNNQLVINTGKVTMANVAVYDISGRLVASKNNIKATETKINVGTTQQVLLVKITSIENGTVTKKVIN